MTTTTTQPPTAQVYQIFIKATPEATWEATIKPEFSAQYFYGSRVETTGDVGAPFRYQSPDGTSLQGDETVLESDPPRRLVVTWRSLYDPNVLDEPGQPRHLSDRAAGRRLRPSHRHPRSTRVSAQDRSRRCRRRLDDGAQRYESGP